MNRAEIEKALYDIRREDGEEFADIIIKALFSGINGRGSEIKKSFIENFFKEHRFLQSEMFGMFFSLCCEIDTKAKEDVAKWFDGRNIHLVKCAEKILK